VHYFLGASAAALAVTLALSFDTAEAASFPVASLTKSGLIVEARYRRHRSYYYLPGNSSYARSCFNRDEIRELQRRYPETNWPPSMRCYPYR
jgi:hypothetical protein